MGRKHKTANKTISRRHIRFCHKHHSICDSLENATPFAKQVWGFADIPKKYMTPDMIEIKNEWESIFGDSDYVFSWRDLKAYLGDDKFSEFIFNEDGEGNIPSYK